MDWKIKIIIAISAIVLIFVLLFIIKIQYDLIRKLQSMQEDLIEMKKIGEDTYRAQTRYVTKDDIEALAETHDVNLKEIERDMKRLGAKVDGIQITQVYSIGYQGSGIDSTATTPNPDPKPVDPKNPDPFGYFANRQELKLTEPFSDGTQVPFGHVGFSAWEEGPWDLRIEPRNYTAITIMGEKEDGSMVPYTEMYVEVDGEKYSLPVTYTTYDQLYPTKKFRFTPRLYLSADFGVIANEPVAFEMSPSLQIALFSHGRTKRDIDWTFLGLGVSYQTQRQTVGLIVAPISYNIGKPLPLVDNLFIGPAVTIDPDGNFGAYMGLRVGL